MGWLFLFFSELLSNKKSRPKERSDRGPFFERQLRELYEADSRNPGSMEAREYGLTRWACLLARHLEVVAVARLL